MAKCIAHHSIGAPPNTYLYKLAHPRNALDTFATIGSDDSLRLFDPALRPTSVIPNAHHGITSLVAQENNLLTTGRDAFMRKWDARQGGTPPILQITDPASKPFSSIACHPGTSTLIALGHESRKEGPDDVEVTLYDLRNPAHPLRTYRDSHSDSITQLAFHATQPDILLSASTDGLVTLFDTQFEDEDDAVQRVLNPRSAVNRAGFLDASAVYVATTDEHFSLHTLAETKDDEPTVLDFGDVRATLDCMYIVDVLAAEAQPMLVCGHNVKQTLELVHLDPGKAYGFGARVSLPGAHGEEVVRDLILLAEEKRAMSCGEDGLVKVWDLAGAMS